jgi:hypothetical protein
MVIAESILDIKLDIEKKDPQKTGTINFDRENQVIQGATPHGVSLKPARPLQKPRGKLKK